LQQSQRLAQGVPAAVAPSVPVGVGVLWLRVAERCRRRGVSTSRSDCPTCGTPCELRDGVHTPLDDSTAGEELLRLEASVYSIHELLVRLGYDGSINGQSIEERIEQMAVRTGAATR
jgi:hypothetical protein